MKGFKRPWRGRGGDDERGSTATEYAVVAALVSVMAIPIWQLIGNRMSSMFFGAVGNAFTHVSGGV